MSLLPLRTATITNNFFDRRRLLASLNDSAFSDDLMHSMESVDDLTSSLDSLVSGNESDVDDTTDSTAADSLANMSNGDDTLRSISYDTGVQNDDLDGAVFMEDETSMGSSISAVPPPADEALSLATSLLVIGSTDDFDGNFTETYSLGRDFSIDCSNGPAATSTPPQSLSNSGDISYNEEDCDGHHDLTSSSSSVEEDMAGNDETSTLLEPVEDLTITIPVSAELRRELRRQAAAFAKINATIAASRRVLSAVGQRCSHRGNIAAIRAELANMTPTVLSLKEKAMKATEMRMLASSSSSPLVTVSE
jgi:hypothetical protein